VLIFQQTGHFFPSAFVVLTIISSLLLLSILTEEVMHSSAKSISFVISLLSSFNFINNAASKLEPIILLALFSSMLRLQISLIFSNFSHFVLSLEFSNFVGIFKNFSK